MRLRENTLPIYESRTSTQDIICNLTLREVNLSLLKPISLTKIYKFNGRWKVYLEYILSGMRAGGTQKQRDAGNILRYSLPEHQLIYYIQGINSRECKTI